MRKRLIIDDILTNPNTAVKFVLPDSSEIISAIYIGDTFNVNGSATYESIIDQPLLEEYGNRKSGKLGTGLTMLKKGGQVGMRLQSETTLSWSGSQRPEFSMTLAFVSVRSETDVRKQVYKFLSGLYPTIARGLMQPPWGYDGIRGKQGRMLVTIGNWFRAPNQVLVSTEFGLSMNVNEVGNNLYAEGNVSFKPDVMPSASQIKSYFPRI